MSMSALYVGLSGLVQSSNALNTTANNLTNVNTKGYVRQQVVYQDIHYNTTNQFATNTLQKGLGVTIQEVSHVRDMFLDKAYRKEHGREGFYEKVYDSVYEIETQLGELNDISFQESITGLLSSINEVAKTPDDNVARAALVQSAVAFLDRSQSVYSGLTSYQNNLNTAVKDTVERINVIGDSIRALNQQISAIESGPETAATLRDQRDLLIDELSGYVKIDYSEDDNGIVTVLVEGSLFCNNSTVSKLALETIEGTEFYNPVWRDMDNMSLYNMNATISTEKNTDIGSLKGLLAARGTISPTYINTIEVPEAEMPDAADYDLTTEDGAKAYKDAMEAYESYRDYLSYTNSSDYSILVNTIANFDKLVNQIVEQINDVLSPTTTGTVTYLNEDGDEVVYTGKILDMEKTGYGMDTAATPGTELFSRLYCERYQEVTGTDGNTYYLYNEINTFGNKSLYSIANIEVNPDILQDFTMIPLTNADGKVDYSRAKELVDIFSEDLLNYNDGIDKLSFEEFYESLIGDVGNTGKIYQSMVSNENSLSAGLDNERQQVMSVSSDEELTNMIKYQQAYNAASRYINVITTMMDTLIQLV